MYRYETHLHTLPVSKCAKASVRENAEFYKKLGYDGIFVTNHFLDGNIAAGPEMSYEDKIRFYFADYEEAAAIGDEIGLKVFPGVEMSYKGTDFLVWGLSKEWFLGHPEIMEMKKSEELPYLREAGALVVQAHPFREAHYIDHIRLYPACIEGVETLNANRKELENRMADIFADEYGFVKTAGSDNHKGPAQRKFAGMMSETPLESVEDFIARVRAGSMEIFSFELPEEEG
ncbi:MAG: PHP domain-containing protein [Clostridia bacterium]|nr:PHP domain-containing protein [Clostridia bacterium]